MRFEIVRDHDSIYPIDKVTGEPLCEWMYHQPVSSYEEFRDAVSGEPDEEALAIEAKAFLFCLWQDAGGQLEAREILLFEYRDEKVDYPFFLRHHCRLIDDDEKIYLTSDFRLLTEQEKIEYAIVEEDIGAVPRTVWAEKNRIWIVADNSGRYLTDGGFAEVPKEIATRYGWRELPFKIDTDEGHLERETICCESYWYDDEGEIVASAKRA